LPAPLLVLAALLAAPSSPAVPDAPSAAPAAAPAAAAAARAIDPAAAPPALRPAIQRAEEAVATLQHKLQGRLGAAMVNVGPSAAVTVCRDEAPRVAAEVAAEKHVRIGRTSDRLRNAKNAPPAWALPTLAAAAGQRAAQAKTVAFDLGDRVGLLRPIAAGPMCLRCHGRPEVLSGDVRASLQGAYPDDRAVGYEEGDLRGFFWVEVPK
jgi:hypothetical protein